MEINWIYASLAGVAGVLAGLYIIGKKSRKNHQDDFSSEPKIKVSGKDMKDLERKMRERQTKKERNDGDVLPSSKTNKNEVHFEFLKSFTYEGLAEWINTIDFKDIDKEAANYGCLIVRSSADIDQFNLDVSKLTVEQQGHIFGAMIVNTDTKKVLAQRWIVCDSIDEDLQNIFGEDNIKMLK